MSLLQALAEFPALFYLSIFVVGLTFGSFLNVVIYRLPEMMKRQWKIECSHLSNPEEAIPEQEKFSLSVPGSRCPSCGHKITVLENIPVISYLMLRGKCSSCKTSISIRYPLIEFLTGALSVIIAMHFGATPAMLLALLMTYALITLTFIDIDEQLLPDNITLPLLWVGLLANLFGTFTDLESAVIGAIFGYLSLWSVFWLFKLLTGKEGMGYGDFKLLAVFGAWLGWQYVLLVILLSSVVGAIIGISMVMMLGKDKNIPIPFGPYLAIAGWIALLYGPELNQLYLNISGIS